MSAPEMDPIRATLISGIQIEVRNAEVYESLATLFDGYNDDVQAIFREMAEEERQHQADLEKRYQERFGPVPTDIEETKDVIEAPDLEDAEALVFDSMTLKQALEVGLEAETMARAFYRRQVEVTTDPELRKLYHELAEFEEDHVRRLQEKLLPLQDSAGSPKR
jgi:rubrerythrin